MKRFLHSRGGFTLMEVLVAVGILAILAAIAVPVVTMFRGGAETDAATAELSNVQAAIDALMVDKEASSLARMPTATRTSINVNPPCLLPGAPPIPLWLGASVRGTLP